MNKIITNSIDEELVDTLAPNKHNYLSKRLNWKSSFLAASLMLSVGQVEAFVNFQKIKIDKKDVSFRKVFQEINKQTGYHYLWTAKSVSPMAKVDMSFHNEPLDQVLHKIESKHPLTFEVEDNVIKIKERNKRQSKLSSVGVSTLNLTIEKEELQQTVNGKVVDENGNALVGVSVTVDGQRKGTLTKADGTFELEGVEPNSKIVISYVGYASQIVSAKTNMGTIRLEPTEGELEAANVRVNTGYQSLPRERMTGAFSYVSGEELESKLATGLKNALEGQAAGVVIDKSGNIEIRGISTFNAQKAPLLVVDGYPIEGSIDDINPLNIESITVLKDGVAASIYGSRAANGVIVITTKHGKAGKPKISYSGFVNIVGKPELKYLNRASTSDYIDAEIDLFNLNPNGPSTTGTGNMSRVTYLLMQVRENKITEAEAMAEINQLRQIDGMRQIEDAFFRKRIVNQHNVGITGGTEEYNYNIAVNYQAAQENLINNDNRRLILDLKNEWRPYKFLTAGASINLNVDNADMSSLTLGSTSLGNNFSSLTAYTSTSLLRPYTNLWNEDGTPADVWGLSQYKENTYQNTPGMKRWNYSPLEEMENNSFSRKNFAARLTGFLRADIIDGLSAEFGGNWVKGNTLIKALQGADAYDVRIAYNDNTSKANFANHYLPDGAVLNENRNTNESWTIRTQLNYAKDFQSLKHRLHAIVGNEIRKISFDNNRVATRMGYNPVAGSFIPVNIKDYTGRLYNSDMLFPTLLAGVSDGEIRLSDNRFVSWYANASYEYDNRFIVSGSTRLDLTNFFGTDEKYRYKPLWSFGGTYKISNEKFWNSNVVNRLHLRGSYGINGNISLDNGPFMILSVGSYTQQTGGVSYGISSPPNNQLRWEKTKIANLGLDFGLFESKLEGSLDYYSKNSTDLLAADAIDPTTGFTSLTKNVGEMTNHGFELSLNWQVVNTNNFRWVVSPNIAYNFNNVKKYNVNRPYAGSYTLASGILAEGYPAAGLWGYRFAGLNKKGETQIYNKDNEKVSPLSEDVSTVSYFGTLRAPWDLALTNRVKYKEWNLSFMFIAKLGHKYLRDAFSGSNFQNRHVGERWRKPGDEEHTIYPVLSSWNMDLFYFPYMDILIENASYAKLRDLTLSYDLGKYTKSIGISNTQLYFQGRNLFRITAKGVDIDPETAEVNPTSATGAFTEQGFTSLPLPREFFLGLRFSF